MEQLFEANLIPRILMTLTALALAIGPAIADFNKTHATNPLWPPHARFHVVWQVTTNSSLCLLMLFILWAPLVEQYNLQLVLVALMQAAILAPLYSTIACMGIFGGALKDVNGIRPFNVKLGGKTYKLDTNVVGFTNISLLLIIAVCFINSSVPVT